MRLIYFVVFLISSSSMLLAHEAQLFNYEQMRNWLSENSYLEEVEAPLSNGRTITLTQHIGRQILAVLKDDAGQRLRVPAGDTFKQAFYVFYSATRDENYLQIDPNFFGHFQLVLSLAKRPLSNDQRFHIYVALQALWAAQAAKLSDLSQLESLLEKISITPVAQNQFSPFTGKELLASLTEMGIPLSLDGVELHPIWRAWDLYKFNGLRSDPLTVEFVPTYFLNFLLKISEAEKQIGSSEFLETVEERLAEHPETSKLSEEIQKHIASTFVRKQPDSPSSLERGVKRDARFRDQLPDDSVWKDLYPVLLAACIERSISSVPTSSNQEERPSEEVSSSEEASPTKIRYLTPLQVRQLLKEIFSEDLATNLVVNEDPQDNHLIKDPRLLLLQFLTEWAGRRADEATLRVPLALYYGQVEDRKLRWDLNMTRLLWEVLLYEMDKTEVLMAQLERLLPKLSKQTRNGEEFSEEVVKEGIAFVLAAWAAGATTKSAILTIANHIELSPRLANWLRNFASVIFSKEELAPDFQNWVYFLPLDQYEDLPADLKTKGEVQWILAHLRAHLHTGEIPETDENISKYLQENIDWSKAPEKLKGNFDAQQALLSVILEENWPSEKEFAKQANNSRRLNGVSFKIPESYLRQFYSEVIKLLRIKLQLPSMAEKSENAAYIKKHLETYLFRILGQSPAHSIRPLLIEAVYEGILGGAIFFNPRWLDTEPPLRWSTYLLREALELPQLAHIRNLHPDLYQNLKEQAPRLDSKGSYQLVNPRAGCLPHLKILTGRNLKQPVPASK